ncbi:MAG: ribosome maturation factor RimM [Tissierellaceae bacterium]
MEYTIIGKIINSHGVKGEVKVYPLTDDVTRFNHLKKAYVGDRKIELVAEWARYHKNLVILKFRDYDDINKILAFKDNFLYVRDDDRVNLPENHFFIYDLLGSHVYDMDSIFIGNLVDILQGAANDVYVVRDRENKEHMIPAVRQFIKDVNIAEKKIIIDPIEGMIT